MKKNIILFSAIFAVLFLPQIVFGYTYIRDPVGSPVSNPVSFYVETDPVEDEYFYTQCILGGADVVFLGLNRDLGGTGEQYASEISNFGDPATYTSFCRWETDHCVDVPNLPEGNYLEPVLYCDLATNDPPEFISVIQDLPLGEDTFEIVLGEEPAGENIIVVGVDFTSGALAYTGRLFTDLKGMILPVLGIIVGFYLINKAIEVVKLQEKKSREADEKVEKAIKMAREARKK